MEEVLKIAREHHFSIGLGGLKPWDTIPYLYSLGGTLTDEKFTKASGLFKRTRNTPCGRPVNPFTR
jgi:multiple sugar transport system substrate-binding protein